MKDIQAALVPGLLALVGVRLASMIAPASAGWQLIAGAGGAIAGVMIAKHV